MKRVGMSRVVMNQKKCQRCGQFSPEKSDGCVWCKAFGRE